jgi:hypothetical protein
LHRFQPKARPENAIERDRRAAPLKMTEHTAAGFRGFIAR